MMKFLMIPRAIVDLIIVLLHCPGNISERLALTKVLGKLKWSLHFRRHEKTVNVFLGGRSIDLFNMVSTQFILKEIWIQQVYHPVEDWKPSRMLDLGGNVGIASLYWMHHFGPVSTHTVLEPDPQNSALLRRNLSGIDVREAAVGWKDDLVIVDFQQDADSVNSRFCETAEGEKLRMFTLETLLQEGFDLVKMDIEGAEWQIFQNVLSNKSMPFGVKYWMIEFHETEKNEHLFTEIKQMFKRMNYKNLQRGDVMHFYQSASF